MVYNRRVRNVAILQFIESTKELKKSEQSI